MLFITMRQQQVAAFVERRRPSVGITFFVLSAPWRRIAGGKQAPHLAGVGSIETHPAGLAAAEHHFAGAAHGEHLKPRRILADADVRRSVRSARSVQEPGAVSSQREHDLAGARGGGNPRLPCPAPRNPL